MLSPQLLVEFATFLFGLLFGSFLNVCISRLSSSTGESIATPRSHCRSCATPIRWHDNIPLLSWILLRARCRHCGASISVRYPLVELGLALWWLFAAHRLLPIFFTTPQLALPLDTVLAALVRTAAFAALGFFLIGLMVTDWETQLLPDLLTIPGLLAGLFFVSLQAMLLHTGEGNIVFSHRQHLNSPAASMARGNIFLTGTEALVFGRIASVVVAAGLLLLIRWLYRLIRHRQGLGLGDVKLLGMIAAFLGLAPTLLALFVGVTTAAAWAVVLLSRRRAGRTTRLPLGSFLCVGALLSAAYGEPLLRWYRSLL